MHVLLYNILSKNIQNMEIFLGEVSMKKTRIKILTYFAILLMLISVVQMPVMAVTKENTIILQKAEKDFIIYYNEICNNEFKFAFSAN